MSSELRGGSTVGGIPIETIIGAQAKIDAINTEQVNIITEKTEAALPSSYPLGVTNFTSTWASPRATANVLTINQGTNRAIQYVSTKDAAEIYYRTAVSDAWTAWKEIETVAGAQAKADAATIDANTYTDTQIDTIEETGHQLLTLIQGHQVIVTNQGSLLSNVKMYGRTDVNYVPLFDSGLWDFHANVTVDSSSKITLDATGSDQRSSITIPVLPSTVYTLSLTHNGEILTRFFDSSGAQTTDGVVSTTTQNKTRTSSADAVEMKVELRNYAGEIGQITFENIMLNKGSTALEFVADVKHTQNPVIHAVGKNLSPTDVNGWEQGTISGTTGGDAPSNARIRIKGFIRATEETDHYYSQANLWSGNVFFYDENKDFISFEGTPNNFTTPSDTAYFRFNLFKDGSPDIIPEDVLQANPQLELGSTATDFTQYAPQYLIAEVKLGSNEEDSVRDELYEDGNGKWNVLKRIEKDVELAEDDIASINTSFTNVDLVFTDNFTKAKESTGSSVDGIMQVVDEDGNILQDTDTSDGFDDVKYIGRYYYSDNRIRFIVAKGEYASITDAKSDLAGIKLSYQLKTPVVEDVTDKMIGSISLHEGQNQIEVTQGYKYEDGNIIEVDDKYNFTASIQEITGFHDTTLRSRTDRLEAEIAKNTTALSKQEWLNKQTGAQTFISSDEPVWSHGDTWFKI